MVNEIKCELKKINDNIHENIKIIKSRRDRVDIYFFLYNVIMWFLGFGIDMIFNPSFDIFLGTVFAQVSGLIVSVSVMIKQYKSIELHQKLYSYISTISENFDDRFYEAYVIINYLDNKKIETKKVENLYEYLSQFDKNKPNSCFNEVGIQYNYRPISEEKVLETEDKQNNLSVNNENGFEVIANTSLVDKYLEKPILLEDNSMLPISRKNCTNLVLKPSVFDKENKKLNRNNDYERIEIEIGKVKVLTINKYRK